MCTYYYALYCCSLCVILSFPIIISDFLFSFFFFRLVGGGEEPCCMAFGLLLLNYIVVKPIGLWGLSAPWADGLSHYHSIPKAIVNIRALRNFEIPRGHHHLLVDREINPLPKCNHIVLWDFFFFFLFRLAWINIHDRAAINAIFLFLNMIHRFPIEFRHWFFFFFYCLKLNFGWGWHWKTWHELYIVSAD